MNLSSKGNQPKATGNIRNNPAFQMFQNAGNPTPAPGAKPIPPEPRGRQPAKQTDEPKVLYPSTSNTTDTHAAPDTQAPATTPSRDRASRSRSQSGSRSPAKLIRSEKSQELPRVQKRIGKELGTSPAIIQAANQVLPKVTGPALKLKINIAAVQRETEKQRATLSEITQPLATTREARSAEKEETKRETRSESPTKKPRSSDKPGSDSAKKKKSGLLDFLEKKTTSHRKVTRASKRNTEVQSPRSPEVIFHATPVQSSSPIQKQLPPTPKTQVSPAPLKPLPLPPLLKQPAATEQTESMPAPPQDIPPPPQVLPEQRAEAVPTQAEVPTASTVSPREEAATPLQTTAPQAAQEKPASEAAKRRTPREPGSPLSDKDRPAPKPRLKPKTPPATPTTVSTTQTETHKDPDSKNET